MKPFLIVLGVVLVIASGIAAWMFLYNEKEPVLEEEVITEDSIDSRYGFEPVPEPDPEPESDLSMDAPGNALAPPASLDESDVWLEDRLHGRSGWLDGLLVNEHLIRKSVTTADLIVREQNPIKHWISQKPASDLAVINRDGKSYISSSGYARYAPAMLAFTALDTDEAETLYKALLPIAEQAYGELGNGDQWQDTAKSAIDRILSYEVPEEAPEVYEVEGVYVFADDTLENLSPVHKLLIRMGPEHAKTLKSRLASIRERL